MKNNRRIKLIAASVALAASLQAHAGLSGLDVRSNLDEPFSGSITVTGEEAKALLGGGSVTVSEKSLTAKVRKLGDKAVITVSSAHAVRDPVLVFRVGAGAQVREYTAILDPAGYSPKAGPAFSNNGAAAAPAENQSAKAPRKAGKKDAADASGKAGAQHGKPARNGKTYAVRKGETLKQVAAALRPKHLTAAQTADALLKANPNVSAHGKLRAGSVIQIPDFSKIKAETPRKIKPEPTPPKTAKPQAAPVPSETPKPAVAAKPAGKPASVPAETEMPAPAKHRPETAPVPSETSEPAGKPASSPAETEMPAPAKHRPETASVPSETPEPAAESAPQEAAASATAAEPAGEIAAEPVAEPAGEVAPEPVAEPAGQAAAEEEETESGLFDGLFGGSYTLLLAGGGAALIALLLLLRLARTKRARRTEESALAEGAESGPDGASDDGIEITFSETEIPTASETAPQPDGNAPLALDEEAEQTLSAEQTFDVGADTPSGHIDLDFDSLETAQNGIVSGALTRDEETQNRENADWNTVESTDSVYEPETPNPYNPVSIVTDTPEPDFTEGRPETAGADSDDIPAGHEEATPAQSFSGTQAPSGLAGFLKGSSPETILEKTVGEVQTPEALHDFLKVYETDTVSDNAPETPDFHTAADDLSALMQPFETPAVEENVTETVAETSDFHTAADDLSALMQPFETPAVEENVTETVAETSDFHTAADDLSALLQPFEAPAAEEKAAETVAETPDFHTVADDLSALLQPSEAPAAEEKAAETVAETPDFHTVADDLSALLQPSEAPAVEENVTETVAETSDFHTVADDLSALLQPSEAPAVEENTAETVAETPDFHTAADDLSALMQPFETPAAEEKAAEITLETPDSNVPEADALPDFLKDGEKETVDWSISLAEENIPSNAGTGFASEAAGSDTPAEAKYDLAEMYLEIGDRDAAAETVKELLEEAEGDVLKRAQTLAQELGI
ncbi:FimV/HubP family polar landmark-like protein TspA [Neisseria lactamica]|uniref:Putative Neisseria-specific antigen protein, TspA n=2 Tax=Neisseria lactamica TaxID=486 RepID=E4ZBB5_NEIL0|nr:FimV/HubP family polar landmark-like protein TspA [Neisseria lactamica]CBN86642.1 Putative Neisseria-specific antigen protein, TspA [Neisseria lactamica 020-06]